MAGIRTYEPLWGFWRIGEFIGEGSFGKVYHVTREDFGKTYHSAVKIISMPLNDSDYQSSSSELPQDAARKRLQTLAKEFATEIDTITSLQRYANIVGYYDRMVKPWEDGTGFDFLIRMELLQNLPDYAAKNPLGEKKVIQLGLDICNALEICSSYNILHRNIKPDNIFVSSRGDFKLGDFGIARRAVKAGSFMSVKESQMFMAPEAYKEDEYDSRGDTYSLGLVMRRILNSNRSPFMPDFPKAITPKDREQSLARRMGGEEIPPLKNVDLELNALILKAVSFDKEDRFQSPAEMRKALESINLQKDFSYVPAQPERTAAIFAGPKRASKVAVSRFPGTDDDEPTTSCDDAPIAGNDAVAAAMPKPIARTSVGSPASPARRVDVLSLVLTLLVAFAAAAYFRTFLAVMDNIVSAIYCTYVAAIFPLATVLLAKLKVKYPARLAPLAVILFNIYQAATNFRLDFVIIEVLPYTMLFVTIYSICSNKPRALTYSLSVALAGLTICILAFMLRDGRNIISFESFALMSLLGFLLGKSDREHVVVRVSAILFISVIFIVIHTIESYALTYNIYITLFFTLFPGVCHLICGSLFTRSKYRAKHRARHPVY